MQAQRSLARSLACAARPDPGPCCKQPPARSAGTREDWRPDAAAFGEADIGDPLANWEGERWLDVTSANVRDIVRKRMEMCRDKVCARAPLGARARGAGAVGMHRGRPAATLTLASPPCSSPPTPS